MKMRHLIPRGIAGQIALLLVASLLLFHGVVAVLLFGVGIGGGGAPRPPDALYQRQLAAVWLIDRAAPSQRQDLIADMMAADPDLALRPAGVGDQITEIDWFDTPERDAFGPWGNSLRAKGIAAGRFGAVERNGDEQSEIAFRLRDGAVMIAALRMPQPPFFGSPLVVTLIVFAVILSVLGVWAARSLTAPLRRFSHAVEKFGNDGTEPVSLAEQGPDELRAAAAAFNRMQSRINDLVEDRTRMLAAVGHDLLTPVTRLRLRTDYVADAPLREAMLSDLDHMEGLLRGAVSYLRQGNSGEKTVVVDLSSLLQTVSDQSSDAGHVVSFDGPVRACVDGRPSELLRLFGNLVDNAIKHGGGGGVCLHLEEAFARIEIIDHGPGIAAGRRDDMLVPFVRGDDARNMDPGLGFGLGLAICLAVAKGHNGQLVLKDTPGGGLTVEVSLPLSETHFSFANA